jgi:SH3-like domain-containing protein
MPIPMKFRTNTEALEACAMWEDWYQARDNAGYQWVYNVVVVGPRTFLVTRTCKESGVASTTRENGLRITATLAGTLTKDYYALF